MGFGFRNAPMGFARWPSPLRRAKTSPNGWRENLESYVVDLRLLLWRELEQPQPNVEGRVRGPIIWSPWVTRRSGATSTQTEHPFRSRQGPHPGTIENVPCRAPSRTARRHRRHSHRGRGPVRPPRSADKTTVPDVDNSPWPRYNQGNGGRRVRTVSWPREGT